MDKLERYLDQVCRGIGGPRSMRQHVRQELKEHIMDAAAEHQAAGMTEEQALDRALEDFGGPEQVRSELEDTHGHRVLTVLIDKAMEWKEKTMKKKWLWTTWAHLMLALVIATCALFIVSGMVLVVPQIKMMAEIGWLELFNPSADRPPAEGWSGSIINFMIAACNYWALWVIPLVIVWGLFEWRARSENKTLIRLAAMGTIALAMTVAVTLFLSSIALPLLIGLQVVPRQPPEPVVRANLVAARASIKKLDDLVARNDWQAIRLEIRKLKEAMSGLVRVGGSAPVIAVMQGQTNIEDVRAKLWSAQQTLQRADMQNKITDAQSLEAAIHEIRVMLDQIPAPATLPAIRAGSN